MKELSIKEKAKRYDEAIERAKSLIGDTIIEESGQHIAEVIFPELKESEDERIKEWLINLVKGHIEWLEDRVGEQLSNGQVYGDELVKAKNSLAWLEWQGEQKPAEKVEPKFKVGDCVMYHRNDSSTEIMNVYDIRDNRYYFNDNIHFSWSVRECDEKCHLWTIKDAKDGDVICCKNGWTCIFKALDNHTNTFSSYCFMDKDKWFCNTGSECHTLDKAFIKAYNGEIYPATKKQRDLFFQKMKEAGYEWDAEKKELNKIEQKPAWSEEDENNILFLTSIIEECFKDKENITLYGDTICANFTKEDVINRLKSLRPQNIWKPSDLQIEALDSATENCAYSEYQDCLRELIWQLKKLREE